MTHKKNDDNSKLNMYIEWLFKTYGSIHNNKQTDLKRNEVI